MGAISAGDGSQYDFIRAMDHYNKLLMGTGLNNVLSGILSGLGRTFFSNSLGKARGAKGHKMSPNLSVIVFFPSFKFTKLLSLILIRP